MKIAAHTLGCRVNQYDTEAMVEQFLHRGYERVGFDEPADVVLVNTCTVTAEGDRKSRQMIRRAAARHPGAVVIVAGCYAQRRPEQAAALPGVGLVVGTGDRGNLVERAQAARRERGLWVTDLSDAGYEALSVSHRAFHTRANLKVQEGCDNRCTYCIIPSVRGAARSRPLADAVAEAERLAAGGCPEIVLTGTHLMSYGRDLPGGPGLMDLIEAVAAAPGVFRIRLGSLDPAVLTEDFITRAAAIQALCPHFHVALQSGSDAVLRAMGRGYGTAQYAARVRALRRVLPDCAVATDMIIGFPGESDGHFEDTLAFVEDMAFARVHVFPYSQRPGTPAARLPGTVPGPVRDERAAHLTALGDRLAGRYARRMIGRPLAVLLEEAEEEYRFGYSRTFVRVGVKTDKPPGAVVIARATGYENGVLLAHEWAGEAGGDVL